MPKNRIYTIVLITIAMFSTSLGDILLAKAVRELNTSAVNGVSDALTVGLELFTLPVFWLAIGLCAVFFFLWMKILSYEELSFVLPMTASTYIINAFLVGPILQESVSPLRWVGTVIIGIGVIVVSLTAQDNPQETKTPEPPPQSEIPAIQR